MFWAICSPSSSLLAGIITTNSSPPIRATWQGSRTASFSTSPARRSSASPAAWPITSLTVFRPLRSATMIVTGVGPLRSRRFSSSTKKDRL